MILTIDVGNTNTVLGIYQEGELINHWRLSTDKDKTADEYGILIYNLFYFAKINPQKINSIIISSVVPPVVAALEEAAQLYFKKEVLTIGPGVKTGMNIKMDNPKEVGADRIVNGVGAFKKYGGPLIIVDFGTATTFCVISDKGNYLGGVIAPGIEISTEALFAHAAKLPRIQLKKPAQAMGKNTISAMQAGIIFGFVGQVEAIIKRLKKEVAREVKVVATGGLVNLIAPETETIDLVEPFLTLEGLYQIGILNGIKE